MLNLKDFKASNMFYFFNFTNNKKDICEEMYLKNLIIMAIDLKCIREFQDAWINNY